MSLLCHGEGIYIKTNKYLLYDIPEKEKQAKNKSSTDKENSLSMISKELEEIKETLVIQNRDNLDALYNIGIDNLDEGLIKFVSQTGDSIASLFIKTDANAASIQAFAEWKDGSGTDSLAGYIANATKDFATVSMLASYTTKDQVNGLINNAKAGIIAEARNGMATISMLANYTTTDEVNNLISSASAGIVSEARDGMATVEMISSVTDIRGDITAASIVAAVNDSSSSVKISADKVDITGFVTFTDLKTPGSVQIFGNTIELTADKYGDSESEVSFLAYSSYDDEDLVMARIITRDNGTSSVDEARRALVIKTNRMRFDSNIREYVAFKVESKGSISLESEIGMVYVESYSDIQMVATRGTIRLAPAYYGSDVSLNNGEYTFCADGIYYGSKLIIEV